MMRTRTLLQIAALLTACALLPAPATAQGQVVTPDQVRRAGYNILPEDRIIQSVRRFLGNPSKSLIVHDLYYFNLLGEDRLYYDVSAADYPVYNEFYESYDVSATDGQVLRMGRGFLHASGSGNAAPTVTLEQARAIAVEFARSHCPPFTRGRWWPLPDKYVTTHPGDNSTTYTFDWYPVLSDVGTTFCIGLTVAVDGNVGQVTAYTAPWMPPILAPVIPRISLQQAIRLAAPYMPQDPAVVPVNEPRLAVCVDKLGVQRLVWALNHSEDPPFQSPLEYGVSVDATTGEVLSVDAPFGGVRSARRGKPLPSPAPGIRVRANSPTGPPVGSWPAPKLAGGILWVRAETLRGFGVRVKADRKRLEVWQAGRPLSGSSLGAVFRDYGWWIPLRRTAERLGWRVEWLPLRREAVVHTGTTAAAFPP